MARRRKQVEEHENHERWLVSYADFITLLFAFFVVMYSLSSINEGKYRVLSDSIVQAFRSLSIKDNGEQLIVPPVAMAPVVRPAPPANTQLQEAAEARRKQTAAQMHNMAEEIRRVMGALAQTGEVNVSEGAFGISIEINAALLFAPGDAALGTAAADALRAVAQVLAASVFPITIEGHTDTMPINTWRFPSNWELSAVRASTVARLFIDSGVRPDRLTAAGYADQRPVADNASEEGRRRNRRVTILLESRDAEPAPVGPSRIAPNDPIRSILPEPPPAVEAGQAPEAAPEASP
ncbi:flagellar motor protein MotD [Thauera linaloolentis]|uniref:Flagellar motor protein MotD n=1 Tax=Thauera linaloolentis (strain DSM 12138 / JCM 21573 / CCUG 41526 / CIP 105981 / IAM 15112 / NBRC 102519 / 47Lol) TaxID=1123367 RepID=N6Z505_THAL4|nr:flagellar motor protein MotD [Thauera linaloolentis]ENO89503.1 flagellar motor protein MotD [Thauera linaloolentis 47Lol = DSM 12138]MCM8565398.1 flagellar motor protein MotD [Thauera linaloolentis]